MRTLKAIVLQTTTGASARLKGLGVVISLAIAAAAIFALMHALKNVDYDQVLAVVLRTNPSVIAVSLMLVAVSYASLTLYDVLALRTISRSDIPYRIAALAVSPAIPLPMAWVQSR